MLEREIDTQIDEREADYAGAMNIQAISGRFLDAWAH